MSRGRAALQVGRGAGREIGGNPWPYLTAPAGAVANLVLSAVLSVFWGAHSGATPWTIAWRAALLVLASGALMLVTWAAGRARQPVLRGASLAMTGCSCTGLFVLTFRGWSADGVGVYLLVMGVCALSLAIIRLLRGDGDDARPHPFGKVAERVAELRAVGSLGAPRVQDGAVLTRVRMEPGIEFADLRKAQGAIATLVPTAVGNVRLIPDRNRPGEGDMEITAHDALETPPPWPGLSAPGGSIAEALRIAVYGNGRDVPVHLFGDRATRRNAIGLLVVAGQPGSGKTALVLGLAAEVLSRVDAHLTLIDCRKGEQLPRWLRDGAKVITNMDAAQAYLATLVDEVPRRARVLGDAGLDQWGPECGLPAEIVIMDEAAKLVANHSEEELVELAESIRSVGILLVLVMQRVTTDRLPSSVKKARGGSICLGLTDDAEAGRVLSESTIDAGASPGALRNARPGCLYVELPGIPEADWSRLARTHEPPDAATLAAAVAPYVRSGGRGGTSSTAAPEATQRSSTAVVGPGDDGSGLPPEPDDPELDGVDPRERIPVPARARISLADGGAAPKWTKADLIAVIRDAILRAHAQGRTRVRASDLGPVVAHVGPDNLKPPRLSGYLAELCQDGPHRLLRREANSVWYAIEPPDDAVPALVSA